MIQIDPLLLLALGELLLIFMVVVLGLVVFGLSRKRNERKAIAKLIRRIKEDKGRRQDETRTLMQQSFGFEGQELDAIVKKISREESRFYQALINLFLKRDLNLLEVLHVECEGVTEPYRTLQIQKPDSGQESDFSTEVEVLKEQNERLCTELGIIMDTMGTMLKEYASMSGGSTGEDLVEAKLIESSSASDEDSRSNGTATPEGVESSGPDSITGQVTPDDMAIEKEESSEAASEQDDSGLFEDAIDIDIGEMLEEKAVANDGMEALSVLDDETLVEDVGDEDLVELEDEDLSLEETILDDGQVFEDRSDRQKSVG